MTDRIRTAPDVPFRPVGLGMPGTFRCAACCKPRVVFGRRLQRVMGLRQYVCAGCARPRSADAA